MHEWLEALRKSAKATSEGVLAEEVRRAETECGIPFPGDLADLYLTLNGGDFEGEVRLYPLRGGEGAPSVLEKSRLKLVGLPAAGVWRFGLKGPHRHLFVARKSAMVEQGDGGGALPGWVDALDADDWVFGTWENEKKEMRLYRTLKDMLEVLVPPVEVESFGERTFARALNAVLQGALSGAEAEDEGASPLAGRTRDYSRDLASLARDVEEAEAEEAEAEAADEEAEAEDAESFVEGEEAEASDEAGTDEDVSDVEEGAQEELFTQPRPARSTSKKLPSRKQSPALPVSGGPSSAAKKGRGAPATSAGKSPTASRARAGGSATKPAAEAPVKGTARKAAVKKGAAKKAAPARGSAKKATGKAAVKKGAAKKATGKAAGKKSAAKKAPGKAAVKKAAPARGSAKKATGKAAAKKGTAQKRGGSTAKKATAKKSAGRSAGARGTTAKKSARRRS
ncbi:hypothetical protein OV207_36185 [Corallococcus sp. BB11-1]|uniref:SMI1/KNR4 family protein n=1 Tax=Corallococcus sp. BB11-1 TaxID=2996783 RepID=UPI00226E7E15|nr:hypothetical protein [Corallococcus sp. BB11-1]MCY1036932.1 hypothetical protein [Corallococcus sp. BB11-1]